MKLRVLRFGNATILEQLRIEEALLRNNSDNWLVLSSGSRVPTIVLGISGKVEELVDEVKAKEAGLSLIRRYSGGGTVVVDHNTLFVSFIMQGSALPEIPCYPRPIMRWSEGIYGPVFEPWGPFAMADNDYAFGKRKFGGNAQAITNQRWVHHTSFLWDYNPAFMEALKIPRKAPAYREGRPHGEFLCKLKDFLPARPLFFESLYEVLESHGCSLEDVSLEVIKPIAESNPSRNVKLLTYSGGTDKGLALPHSGARSGI